MIRLWHCKVSNVVSNPRFWPRKYEFIAELDAFSLDRAEALSVSWEQPWWKGEQVHLMFADFSNGVRSSRPGDIFEINGRLFMLTANPVQKWRKIDAQTQK